MQMKGDNISKKIRQQESSGRVFERCKKSDSFVNIRLTGNVFLHSSTLMCMYACLEPGDLLDMGITHLSAEYSIRTDW